MASNILSSVQLYALLDILTHHEAYAEIQNLKYQATIKRFDYPLQSNATEKPSSPLLQVLMKRFVLVLQVYGMYPSIMACQIAMVSGDWGALSAWLVTKSVSLSVYLRGGFWCGVFTGNEMTKHDPYLINQSSAVI